MATLTERLKIGQSILEQHFDVTTMCSSPNDENSYFAILGKEMSPNQNTNGCRIALKDFQIKNSSVFKSFIPVHCSPTQPTPNLSEEVEKLAQDLVSPTPRDLFASVEMLGRSFEVLEFLGTSKHDILHSNFRYLHLVPATSLSKSDNQSLCLLMVKEGETRCFFKKISDIPPELRHSSGHRETCDLSRFSNQYQNIFRKTTEVTQGEDPDELVIGDDYDLFSCISLYIYGSFEFSDFVRELAFEYEGTKDHEGVMSNLIAREDDNEKDSKDIKDDSNIDQKKQEQLIVEKHLAGLRSRELLPGNAEIHVLAKMFNTSIYVCQLDNRWEIFKPFCDEYKAPFASTIELQVVLPFHFAPLCRVKDSCRCVDKPLRIKGPLSDNLRSVDSWIKQQRENVPCCPGHQHLGRWHNETSIQPDQKRGEFEGHSGLARAVQRKLEQEGRCLEQAGDEEETLWQTLSLEVYGNNVNADYIRQKFRDDDLDDDQSSLEDMMKMIWKWLQIPIYVLHVESEEEMVWKAYGDEVGDPDFHCRFYLTMAFYVRKKLYKRILPKEGCNCMFLPPLLTDFGSVAVENGIGLNINTMHLPMVEWMRGHVAVKTPEAPRKSTSNLRVFSELYLLAQREDMQGRLIEEMDKCNNSLFRCISRVIMENDEHSEMLKALVAEEIRNNPTLYGAMIPKPFQQTFSLFTFESTKHKEHADILASRVEYDMEVEEIEVLALSNFFQVEIYILSTLNNEISNWRVIRPFKQHPEPKNEHSLVSKCGKRVKYVTLAKSIVGTYHRIIPKTEECNCQMDPPTVRGSARAFQTLYPNTVLPLHWMHVNHCRECEMDILKVRKALDEWLRLLDMFQEFCNVTIESLELHRRNVNIAAIVGSATGIVGAGLAITGAALAPVTFGASLGLTIAGASIGAVGGATSVGSKITEAVINKNPVKTLQRLQTYFEEKSKVLEEAVNIMLPSSNASNMNPNDVDFHSEGYAVPGVLRTAKAASTIPLLIARSSITVASTVAFVLGPLSAIIDLGLILVSAFNLKSGSRTLVTENLRGLANLLRLLRVQMETELFGTENYN